MSPDEQTTCIFTSGPDGRRTQGALQGLHPVIINSRPAKRRMLADIPAHGWSAVGFCGFQSFFSPIFFFLSLALRPVSLLYSSAPFPYFPLKSSPTAGPSCIQLLLPLYISLPPHIDPVPGVVGCNTDKRIHLFCQPLHSCYK